MNNNKFLTMYNKVTEHLKVKLIKINNKKLLITSNIIYESN